MRKILLLFILIAFGLHVNAQKLTAKTGDWLDDNSWSGGAPGLNNLVNSISVNHYITRNGDLNFPGAGKDNTKVLEINDDFVVYGNVNFEKDAISLMIGANGRMIVFGNVTSGNKVSLANTGVLVVTGTLDVKNGAGSFTNNGGITFAKQYNGQVANDPAVANYLIGNLDTSTDPRLGGIADFVSGRTTTLPVKWEYVRAAYDGNLLNVEWATAQEENNERFTVELSRDGLSWQQVKEVAGAGTTYEQQNYQASISISGFNYLRIKQTDYDGQFDYSAIIRISGAGSSSAQAVRLLEKMYPNPVQEELSLQLTASAYTPVRIQVMTVTGTLLMEFETGIQAGVQLQKIQLGQLAKGTYLLGVENLLTGVTEVKRFQKL